MNIVVCMKQILDPELPARDFRIDTAQRGRGAAAPIWCPTFSARTRSRQLCSFARHTAEKSRRSLAVPKLRRKCYARHFALKADEAALVVSEVQGVPDPLFVARALAAAIRKLGPVDLVFTGREAGDWGAGQTGGLLAEELGVPSISFVENVEPGSPGTLKVKRQTDSGWESFEATLPLVATITNHEKNVPRIPKTRDVMQSFRKPITKWTLAELDLDPSQANSYYEVAELSIPRKETQCEFVAGETLEEKVAGFAHRVTEIMRSI